MANKIIKLKNSSNDYLFPLAYADADENVIKDTYLIKVSTSEKSADPYIKSAEVSTSATGEQVLTLINQDGEEVVLTVSNVARFG